MKNKRKRNLFLISGLLALILVPGGIKIASDITYRRQLPELPDFQNISAPLKEQIFSAQRKARFRPTADNLGMLGMVYHSSAYYDKAAQAYELAVRKKGPEWIWTYYLGYLNQEMGDANNSIENFRNVIKDNPESLHSWYYVARGYQSLGEGYKAEVAYKNIVKNPEKISPENSSLRTDYFPLRVYALYNLSRIYIASDRSELAELTLKEILRFHRSFGPAYRLLGDIYKQKGDSVLSSYYILRANDVADLTQPVDTLIDKIALLSRSETYILRQIDESEKSIYPDWALELTKNALKFNPEDKNLISRIVKLSVKLDHPQDAEPFLEKHMTFYRDDFNELVDVGDLFIEKGSHFRAMIYYNQALNLNPDDIDAQLGLVSCLWNTNMTQNALSQIDTLLKRNEGNIKAETEIVQMLIQIGEKGKASGWLSKMRRYSPDYPGVQKLSGMIAELDGNLKNATAFYTSAYKKDPRDFPTVKYLGSILIRQELWSSAIAHYKKALEYFPNEPYFLERVGTLLVSCPEEQLRNYKEGKEYSERAFIHTGCPTATLIDAGKSLAEAYAGQGDFNNASLFMNITLNLAKSENFTPDYIADLQNKLKIYNQKK